MDEFNRDREWYLVNEQPGCYVPLSEEEVREATRLGYLVVRADPPWEAEHDDK